MDGQFVFLSSVTVDFAFLNAFDYHYVIFVANEPLLKNNSCAKVKEHNLV